jgi:hypothetical protein
VITYIVISGDHAGGNVERLQAVGGVAVVVFVVRVVDEVAGVNDEVGACVVDRLDAAAPSPFAVAVGGVAS